MPRLRSVLIFIFAAIFYQFIQYLFHGLMVDGMKNAFSLLPPSIDRFVRWKMFNEWEIFTFIWIKVRKSFNTQKKHFVISKGNFSILLAPVQTPLDLSPFFNSSRINIFLWNFLPITRQNFYIFLPSSSSLMSFRL